MNTKVPIKSFLLATALVSQTRVTAQRPKEAMAGLLSADKIIEIRSYHLKPGAKQKFHRLVTERSLPLLKKRNIDVIAYGPSVDDSDTYFLMRSYKSIPERQQSEDAFYGSDDWKKGPRTEILSLIQNYITVIIPVDSLISIQPKLQDMISTAAKKEDCVRLHELNARFIKNFLRQDATAHNEIIHKDFVCIQGNGSIVHRDEYLKNWATDFTHSGYTSFAYTDETIRIFGNMALVRAKTVFTRNSNAQREEGNSIYTDTYLKENGRWLCVQAQITPVK